MKKWIILVIIKLLKPIKKKIIIVEVAATSSEHKFCSLLKG